MDANVNDEKTVYKLVLTGGKLSVVILDYIYLYKSQCLSVDLDSMSVLLASL